MSAFQEMHGKAAETQVFVRTDWIADISIRSVGLLVAETVNRHRKKLHAILKILIHMIGRGAVNMQQPPTKGLRSSFVGGKNTKSISNHLEALLDSFRVFAPLIKATALRINIRMKALHRDGI